MAKEIEKKVILATYGQDNENETPMQRAFRLAKEAAEQKAKK